VLHFWLKRRSTLYLYEAQADDRAALASCAAPSQLRARQSVRAYADDDRRGHMAQLRRRATSELPTRCAKGVVNNGQVGSDAFFSVGDVGKQSMYYTEQ
jgi:hypothetical protein